MLIACPLLLMQMFDSFLFLLPTMHKEKRDWGMRFYGNTARSDRATSNGVCESSGAENAMHCSLVNIYLGTSEVEGTLLQQQWHS